MWKTKKADNVQLTQLELGKTKHVEVWPQTCIKKAISVAHAAGLDFSSQRRFVLRTEIPKDSVRISNSISSCCVHGPISWPRRKHD